ncbi:MAG TPA: pyruvate kinase alpha/beta domain-containing protein [Bacillota bacterium]|nr:pyruvate kinase alpha/beta domain-containing protein [Bacillota bacterium]
MKVFAQKGPVNTAEVVELTIKRAHELGVKHVVVASNSGATAREFLGHGLSVVCVTHHVGFRGPGIDEMPAEMRSELTERGAQVLTTTHLFGGVERGYANKLSGYGPAYITAATLRMFGQGTKVAVEIAVMALDSGMIPYGEDIIAVGGSGGGADTSVVIRPAHANKFTETVVSEIICKPGVV